MVFRLVQFVELGIENHIGVRNHRIGVILEDSANHTFVFIVKKGDGNGFAYGIAIEDSLCQRFRNEAMTFEAELVLIAINQGQVREKFEEFRVGLGDGCIDMLVANGDVARIISVGDTTDSLRLGQFGFKNGLVPPR